MDEVASRFQSVTAELVQALDFLPYHLLDVSDEVREQVSFGRGRSLRPSCAVPSVVGSQ
jgi:hypothetical protein